MGPDGRRLVVERSGRLFVIRADLRGERFLANGREPTWSQKRNRIAFVGRHRKSLPRPPHGPRAAEADRHARLREPARLVAGREKARVRRVRGRLDGRLRPRHREREGTRLTQDLNGERRRAGLNGRRITFVGDLPAAPSGASPPPARRGPSAGPSGSTSLPGGRRSRSSARRTSTSARRPTCPSSARSPAATSSASRRRPTSSARGRCRSWPRVQAAPCRPCAPPSGCG